MPNEDFPFDRSSRLGGNLNPITNFAAPTAPSILLPTARPLSLAGWMAARAGEKMMQGVALEAMHDQCTALRVASALQNMGALSALEAHLQQIAPLGSERCRMILDAYAINLAIRLAK